MRGILRIELRADTAERLRRLQDEVDRLRADGSLRPSEHWKSHYSNPPIPEVLAALQEMAGKSQRCMYCVDSAGTDIEHFWPLTRDPHPMYVWKNLLIVCSPCNRYKGIQFPQTVDREPLLIDPSAEDPWEFLDFDPETGNLNARYLRIAERYSAKGEETVKVLHLDRREGVSVGYLNTYNRLCKLVKRWTDGSLADDYVERLREEDERGLLGWFLHGSGASDPPFSQFRERYPEAWNVCQQSFR